MAIEAVRQFWRTNVKKRRQEARLRGDCAICITRKAKPGGSSCEKCLKDARDRRKRSA